MKASALEITFADRALARRLGSDKSRRREFGDETARLIARRLNELRAAPDLAAMRTMPGRCHELVGDRSSQLALSVTANLRLVFEPLDDPAPTKDDGGLDWDRVTAVIIREVVDYHA